MLSASISFQNQPAYPLLSFVSLLNVSLLCLGTRQTSHLQQSEAYCVTLNQQQSFPFGQPATPDLTWTVLTLTDTELTKNTTASDNATLRLECQTELKIIGSEIVILPFDSIFTFSCSIFVTRSILVKQ